MSSEPKVLILHSSINPIRDTPMRRSVRYWLKVNVNLATLRIVRGLRRKNT